MNAEDLTALVDSFEIHLAAERKSEHTVRAYLQGIRRYAAWCEARGLDPDLAPNQVKQWMAADLAAGFKATSVKGWHAAVRAFSAWLAKEDGTPDPIAAVRPPKLDEPIPPYVTPDQLGALLATCTGRSFHDVRDRAIIGLLLDTMARASELLSMTIEGTSVKERTTRIEFGKGRKGRVVAYSAQTARDLDRYLRMRKGHRLHDQPWVWLPLRVNRGKTRLAYSAMYRSLQRRALAADPPFRLHPHMLRSTGAITFRRRGGQVTSLMALGGWNDISMVQRYIRAAENELAVEEAHRLFDKD